MNTNKKLISPQWQEEEALARFQIISPLLDESLDEAKYIQLRRKQAEKYNLSDKTVRRYVNAYRQNGFEGLKPRARHYYQKGNLPDNYKELVQEAIQLRREVPSRSVEKIILILEMEKRVAPGVLKRSTLQRHMYEAGFGAGQMEVYREARKSSSKRYCKPHRMMLVQGDIKEGIYLPIGKNGAKVKTYLSSAIDDHSRMILSSKFYDNEEEKIVEDTFHNAILKYGRFDRCYFDHGSQYTAKQLKLSLAKLSIRVSLAPVASGKSKGKIEKFHQVVSQFLDEAKAKKIKTLEELKEIMKGKTAIAVGPGLGQSHCAEEITRAVLRSQLSKVVDADALNLLAKHPAWYEERNGSMIVTPHPAEMSRLSQMSVNDIQADRHACAKAYAKMHHVIMVLKGSHTIVTDGTDEYINDTGNHGMATAGSGDVLTGIIGGFLAQHIEPFEAARLGVYVHGLAGDDAKKERGTYSMMASDIVEHILYGIE